MAYSKMEHPGTGSGVEDSLPNGITCVSPRVSPMMQPLTPRATLAIGLSAPVTVRPRFLGAPVILFTTSPDAATLQFLCRCFAIQSRGPLARRDDREYRESLL